MFPGFFIPGLVSFLIAHLFYIALFKPGLPWFPNRLAGLFMLSDALLAIDKFALPLPMAQFWVLASYYAAQILIDGGILRALQPVLVTRARSLQEAAPAT